MTTPQIVRIKDVIGKDVIDSDKENLGQIEEIAIDKVSGQVRYAVLSFGGFLKMGQNYYAVPWSAMEYCKEEEAFKLEIDKEKLKSAFGFDKDNWPDFADEGWGKSIRDFYNTDY